MSVGATTTRYVVVGGGIVGAAVAHRLTVDRPDATVTLLEKERELAEHQSGRNSGVVHAGVYYPPGSLKATLCRAGRRSMVEFCQRHDLPVRVSGKLIVATDPDELPRLRALHERALANELPVRLLDPAEAGEYEPHVRCVGALHVAGTAVADFAAVARTLAGLARRAGAGIRTGTRMTGLTERPDGLTVHTSAGDVPADVLINCAGLYADRVARLAGVRPPARIVPFRGEYHTVRGPAAGLVRGLIYPVPDPRLPFLGVHLTRGVDGSVHAGPNAVLALARQGYSWRRFDPVEVARSAAYPGLWRLARRYGRTGMFEVRRSLSKRRFAADLARLVPALSAADLAPARSGVRAQAVRADGTLVDDFLVLTTARQVHLLNAPSPAATSALEIAGHLVGRLPI